jgi:hypothetical protein
MKDLETRLQVLQEIYAEMDIHTTLKPGQYIDGLITALEHQIKLRNQTKRHEPDLQQTIGGSDADSP